MKAIYAGSFDPYTNGHKSILLKACALFDEVHIVIGINANKKRTFNVEDIKNAIEIDLKNSNINNCKVVIYDGITAIYCKENQIQYMIRGLRNNMDYNYEENMAEVNKLINPDLESIYMRAEEKAISSSMVKELLFHKQDISAFVPDSIINLIK
jgi:pantetheine-phosphate adenylyltransferase